ncbi:E3 ubiquitin-protein ligase MBR2-like [Populus nigra]|uniref:E3 ubiquitin-protein ligase MBR2-like n=1 Tax=Populus nigra TaxID=3691 RepID=UPI002B266C0E|nr:E3 ubiquitin-protein ligase MBR2-like [Populus nigra]XP_061966352.1 E3 ubiquitin-protein ligase MBR2-like [Populus nigra]
MDDNSCKRTGDGSLVSRKGSAHVLRDSANNRDQKAQFCNRIGCSGRLNSSKGAQISSEKAKSSRPRPLFSSSAGGKETIGSSSRTCSVITKPRNSLQEPRKKFSSRLEADSSETGSVQDEPEGIPSSGRIKLDISPSDGAGSSDITSMEVGSCGISTNTRSRRNFHQKSGFVNPETVVGSPVSLASKSTIQGTRVNASRYGLKNPRCNTVSDAASSGSSSSDSNLSRRKDIVRKRVCDVESSFSARGKKMIGSSLEGRSASSSPGISISDSRRSRTGPLNRDSSAASVRTRRPLSGYARARFSNQGGGNNLSANEIPLMSQPDISLDLNAPSSSHQFSMEASLSRPSSYSRPGSRSYSRPGSRSASLQGITPSSPAEASNARSIMNRESFRHHNMDGIAEVLLALERIEQDEEPTYEQLLVLETNLVLNGLNFYDLHREMRLDIDNMSYEELLALEERMGTVSTALTEEAFSECLKTSIYEPTPMEDATTNLEGDKDDIRCSICQEEYADGDEVGRLPCEHRYHVACIHQWLSLKNWCPICKTSAAPSSSSSSPLPSL